MSRAKARELLEHLRDDLPEEHFGRLIGAILDRLEAVLQELAADEPEIEVDDKGYGRDGGWDILEQALTHLRAVCDAWDLSEDAMHDPIDAARAFLKQYDKDHESD